MHEKGCSSHKSLLNLEGCCYFITIKEAQAGGLDELVGAAYMYVSKETGGTITKAGSFSHRHELSHTSN